MSKKNQETELVDEHIADAIDFDQIFKVAERPGLWTPRSAPNRDGFVGIRKFLSSETKISNVRKITPLGRLVFYNNSAQAIPFKKVFKNIFDWESKNGKEIVEIPLDDAMNIAVPDFDETEFKPHHMNRVINWFQIIIKTLSDAGTNFKTDKKQDQERNDVD